MKQYIGRATKKPVEVHWFKWRGLTQTNLNELKAWLESFKWETGDKVKFEDVIELGERIRVKTLEGSSYEVPYGYIIIRGVKGEFYPIDSEIFSKTYNII